jgi:hypothetical protein
MGMTTTVDGTTGITAPNGAIFNGIASGTAIASTSGTSIDFTSIPSWVKRITVMLNGVSTNGSSLVIVQLGTGGVATTSGYTGGVSQSATYTNLTTGLGTNGNNGATDVRNGMVTIANISGNNWVSTSIIFLATTTFGGFGSGTIALSGVLNLVRITTVNGTDTFDAGSVNILYE